MVGGQRFFSFVKDGVRGYYKDKTVGTQFNGSFLVRWRVWTWKLSVSMSARQISASCCNLLGSRNPIGCVGVRACFVSTGRLEIDCSCVPSDRVCWHDDVRCDVRMISWIDSTIEI
jgi:hypothetical protein